MARWRKLAVWAMFFPFKEHKPYQGTLGSLEVILIGSRIRPGPSMDPTGTLKWTSWFSRKIQAKIPFVHYTLSSPPKTFWNTFWSLWNCTSAQRTLLDHHVPPNGPQNGSCEANFGESLVKKRAPRAPSWSKKNFQVLLIIFARYSYNRKDRRYRFISRSTQSI